MQPGTSLAGKYRLLRPLGKGTMGEVWAALHLTMGREVAIKLLNNESQDLAVRLKREAQACGRLEHPNIVRVYDIADTPTGQPFLVMELLNGETLARRMARKRQLPVATAVGIALAVARALRAAHAASIVHRDLKPANIYLHKGADSEEEEIKVLDFGVSKILASDDASFTVTGMLVGSPAYMSPEQAQASKQIDARADLWSVGVLLFEMLTGRWPFQSTAPLSVISEILAGPLPTLRSILPDVDPRLDETVRRCLERDVDQRMPSATALIDALKPVLSSNGAQSQRPPLPGPQSPRAPLPGPQSPRAPLVGAMGQPSVVVASSPHDEPPTNPRKHSAPPNLGPRGGHIDDDEVTRMLPHGGVEDLEQKTFRIESLPAPLAGPAPLFNDGAASGPIPRAPAGPFHDGAATGPIPRAPAGPEETQTRVFRELQQAPPHHEAPEELALTEKWDRSLAPSMQPPAPEFGPDMFRRNLRLPAWFTRLAARLPQDRPKLLLIVAVPVLLLMILLLVKCF